MHGTVHGLDEVLDDHPNGRCSMLPHVKPLAGMAAQTLPESGPAQFARLDPAAQDVILGKAAGRAYRAGAIRLEDVVGRTFDPDWGPLRRVKSLQEMVGAEEARKWRRTGSQRADLPAKPASKKISEVLDMSKMPGPKAALRQSVDRALAAIESVHGIPDNAPNIPLNPTSSAKKLGRYRYTEDGQPVEIGVSQKGSRPELTLAHEVGHYLDHQVLDRAGVFASETSGKLETWRKVVRESEAVKNLQTALDTGKVLYPDGNIGPSDIGWLRQALSHEELFARSYAQYIAEAAQDEAMLKSIAELRQQSYLGVQWSREDFSQIQEALDELLAVLGWRK